MRYEKEGYVGSKDKIPCAQQALTIWQGYAASLVKGEQQIRHSEGVKDPSQPRPTTPSKASQGEQSQSGAQEITVSYWLSKCGR